ncbi:hypothetical protein DSECCO2_321410 [anaerobic digester metagenome]
MTRKLAPSPSSFGGSTSTRPRASSSVTRSKAHVRPEVVETASETSTWVGAGARPWRFSGWARRSTSPGATSRRAGSPSGMRTVAREVSLRPTVATTSTSTVSGRRVSAGPVTRARISTAYHHGSSALVEVQEMSRPSPGVASNRMVAFRSRSLRVLLGWGSRRAPITTRLSGSNGSIVLPQRGSMAVTSTTDGVSPRSTVTLWENDSRPTRAVTMSPADSPDAPLTWVTVQSTCPVPSLRPTRSLPAVSADSATVMTAFGTGTSFPGAAASRRRAWKTAGRPWETERWSAETCRT